MRPSSRGSVRDLSAARFVLGALAGALALLAAGAPPAQAANVKLRFTKQGYTRIPFDLRVQHVWVRGRVNGSDSAWIVIDTGASGTVIDSALANQLSMKLKGEARSHGAGGLQIGMQARDLTIELPGLSIERNSTPTINMGALSAAGGRPMQVVMGYELFENCVVRFDYAASMLEIWDKKSAPRDLPGTAVPMTLERNHPYVEAELSLPGHEPIRGRFIIDSGSSQALILARDVVARESLITGFPRTLLSIGRGVGGEVRSRVGRAESFAIGELKFERPIVAMPETTAFISAPGTMGNIGGQILGRCRVTYDYSNKRIYFEPSPTFAKAFEADMSGAVFTRTANGFEVRHVSDDSPAAEAGLMAGDFVTEIDGEPAERIEPPAFRMRLQEEGRTVKLVARRQSESREFTLKLRRLI